MTALPGLDIRRELDAARLARLQQRQESDILRRFADQHRAYVAWLDDVPVAWGWVATRSATIGELELRLTLDVRERYLWNFSTLPAFRGRGIYPVLLERIVQAESAEAEGFWIAWAPENHASGAGIRKAGFRHVAELSFDLRGRPAVHGRAADGASAAAALVGVPEASAPLAPCWRCVRAGHAPGGCAPGTCTCDYQVPTSGCAA
jgi:GNAT superfamily N-acetyltransferase